MTDEQIIEGFRLNDRKTINTFYSVNRDRFFSYFRNAFGKSDEELIDLYQDSCVTLWENANNGRLKRLTSTLSTYLFAVGKYKMMANDRKFKEMASDIDLQNLNLVEDDPEEIEERESRLKIIDEIVDEMKYPCSDILRMHYWEKCSGEEIAEKMQYKNPDAVKTQKYKCMQKLKKVISERISIV